MRLGKYLSGKTKSELEILRNELNLSDDEEVVFNCLAKGKSNVATAYKCQISTSTLSNRIKSICLKLDRIEGR